MEDEANIYEGHLSWRESQRSTTLPDCFFPSRTQTPAPGSRFGFTWDNFQGNIAAADIVAASRFERQRQDAPRHGARHLHDTMNRPAAWQFKRYLEEAREKTAVKTVKRGLSMHKSKDQLPEGLFGVTATGASTTSSSAASRGGGKRKVERLPSPQQQPAQKALAPENLHEGAARKVRTRKKIAADDYTRVMRKQDCSVLQEPAGRAVPPQDQDAQHSPPAVHNILSGPCASRFALNRSNFESGGSGAKPKHGSSSSAANVCGQTGFGNMAEAAAKQGERMADAGMGGVNEDAFGMSFNRSALVTNLRPAPSPRREAKRVLRSGREDTKNANAGSEVSRKTPQELLPASSRSAALSELVLDGDYGFRTPVKPKANAATHAISHVNNGLQKKKQHAAFTPAVPAYGVSQISAGGPAKPDDNEDGFSTPEPDNRCFEALIDADSPSPSAGAMHGNKPGESGGPIVGAGQNEAREALALQGHLPAANGAPPGKNVVDHNPDKLGEEVSRENSWGNALKPNAALSRKSLPAPNSNVKPSPDPFRTPAANSSCSNKRGSASASGRSEMLSSCGGLCEDELQIQWKALQVRLEELEAERSQLLEAPSTGTKADRLWFSKQWDEIENQIKNVKKLKGRNATARCRLNAASMQKIRRLQESDDENEGGPH